MTSQSSFNQGTPGRNNKVDVGTQVSPSRVGGSAHEYATGASPVHQGPLAEVDANVGRLSPFDMGLSSTPSTVPANTTGVMRTRRRARRHNPLARVAPKKKDGDENNNKQPQQQQQQGSNQAGDHDSDDSLDGVEADVDDLVGPDDNGGNAWAANFPGLVDQVKNIACQQSAVRGIHDDSEEGLRFMVKGVDFD